VGYIDDADPKKESIYIEPGLLNTALDGDKVEVAVGSSHNRGKTEKTGTVTKVIERAKEFFVGTVLFEEGGQCVVIPDDRKMYTNIVIPEQNAGGLKTDQKVYVKLMEWNDPEKLPVGRIERILGEKGNNNVEMESIVLEKGFEVVFPKNVENEATEIGKNKIIPAEEIAKRRDMRGTPTFTIDPFDAKDFDDAISIKKMPDGLFEIGIHIADVSHYVREGTALDKEAVKRGCSVYLVDRTIPMLPEVLSNDVCSLNPQEDKLSFSTIFTMDNNARVQSRWFGKTVMNSTHRFTYETAQAVIDGNASLAVKYSNNIQTTASAEAGMKYHEALVDLDRLAKILKKEKFSKGAIEFEQDEIKFRLDETGKPIGIVKSLHLDTHKLVEEFMLLANREVAKYISDSIKKKGTRDTGAIYRIHDVPDKDKIMNLASFVKALGYTLKTHDGVVTGHSLNDLLDQIEDTPHESLVRTATIRSMQKAVYSTKNIGHFGLGFSFYTHFTSPIRRYPDLLVHRVLAKHLSNEKFGDRDVAVFQNIADSSTAREISAAEAERASKKLKQVEYMSERIGQTFKGTITGVTKWGIYVAEIETMCEGMIHISNLGEDYFNFDEKTYSIVGEKSGKKFTLGNSVTFKVKAADIDKRMLDFGLV
jgi:ribonuclease R